MPEVFPSSVPVAEVVGDSGSSLDKKKGVPGPRAAVLEFVDFAPSQEPLRVNAEAETGASWRVKASIGC